MNGGQLTAVLIVAIVMIAMVLKSGNGRRHRRSGVEDAPDSETLRLREEVRQLKDRLHVLERIATEKENSLSREIEELRDR